VLERFEAASANEAIKAKIRNYLRQFGEWRVFHGGESIAVERFLDESVRLDLSQLDETARNILADVVLRRLFLVAKALGPLPVDATGWSKFRAYVAIDEAHLLMGGSADARGSLSKYAAEARKFGIGLILATQLRDNVPAEIWGNIDTRLFMQALDPVERARNAKAANVPELVLQQLAKGEAILTSSSQPGVPPRRIRIEPPGECL
jgi:DNA helicase HerA-like ATPase